MDEAIKKIIVPELRKKGFSGSYPHFRNAESKNVKVLGFQFSQFAPRFSVELASCPKEGITYPDGRHVESTKIKYTECIKRGGLGEQFDFENGNYKELCNAVISLFRKADEWWKNN